MALRWHLSRASPDSGRLFASLQYSDDRRASADWNTVATLHADGRPHQYTARDNGHYRLVFQPELGVPIQARLAIVRGGSLPFPVVGGHEYDIGGGFGAPRDGGKRRHKGVDIFADRDTAVRAAHYIVLSSGFTGPRFYYAHLDHFAVKSGTRVDASQIIGYVGNSGNAAGGPTHPQSKTRASRPAPQRRAERMATPSLIEARIIGATRPSAAAAARSTSLSRRARPM